MKLSGDTEEPVHIGLYAQRAWRALSRFYRPLGLRLLLVASSLFVTEMNLMGAVGFSNPTELGILRPASEISSDLLPIESSGPSWRSLVAAPLLFGLCRARQDWHDVQEGLDPAAVSLGE